MVLKDSAMVLGSTRLRKVDITVHGGIATSRSASVQKMLRLRLPHRESVIDLAHISSLISVLMALKI